MPIDCTHGKVTDIPGALFTVNPIAINQPVNVYTENKRGIVELDSKEFGKVCHSPRFRAKLRTSVYVVFRERFVLAVVPLGDFESLLVKILRLLKQLFLGMPFLYCCVNARYR